MRFRLRNREDTDITLGMTNQTWYSILNTAEEYGWNPMGTVLPDGWDMREPVLEGEWRGPDGPIWWHTGYANDEDRLVLFEDALNLADALDRAFLDYEPRPAPSPVMKAINGSSLETNHEMPAVGVIMLVIDMCQQGSFWIEKF